MLAVAIDCIGTPISCENVPRWMNVSGHWPFVYCVETQLRQRPTFFLTVSHQLICQWKEKCFSSLWIRFLELCGTGNCMYPLLFFFYFLFLFFFFLAGLLLQHMELPRLGSNWSCSYQPQPQPQPCQNWAMSLVCDLHHSSWQHWILNLLSEARDQIRTLLEHSQVFNRPSSSENSRGTLYLINTLLFGPKSSPDIYYTTLKSFSLRPESCY